MSGGALDYQYYRVEELADEIERKFINDGKYMGDDWEDNSSSWELGKPQKEYDRLEDSTPEERELILIEISMLIPLLRNCSKRAKELEWYLSGDLGATIYLKRLEEINL